MTLEKDQRPGRASPSPAAEAWRTPRRLQALVELWREAGRRTQIPVAGRSMYPLLRTGWTLEMDHRMADHPHGSIIVFLQGRVLVAHRVVGRWRNGAYLTKGDALLHYDRRPVPPARVLGRVLAVHHAGGVIRLTGRRQRLLGHGVALLSRLVAVLHRTSAPVRRWTSAAGRLPGSLPGPTRVLGACNRWLMALAGSLLGRPQSPPKKSGAPVDGGGA